MTAPTGVLRADTAPITATINAAIKAALLLAFAVAIVVPPDAVAGKAMGFRAPLFLAPAVLVPVMARRRGWEPYSHTADALISLPFARLRPGPLRGLTPARSPD